MNHVLVMVDHMLVVFGGYYFNHHYDDTWFFNTITRLVLCCSFDCKPFEPTLFSPRVCPLLKCVHLRSLECSYRYEPGLVCLAFWSYR